MRITSGTTDQYLYFVAVDKDDLRTRETGLTTFTVYRSRNGAAAAAMTTPTIAQVDATNMPGVYTLLLDEDMTLAAGNDSEEMIFHITQAAMAPVSRAIELYRPKITVGETVTATAGRANANIVAILGAAITGTAAQIAAAFTAWFDVAAPTGTVNSLPAGIPGAAGGLPVSAAGSLDLDALNTAAVRLTAARAGVLDDWINAGRLDAILDTIAVDVAGLDGAAMRGTDSAATASALATVDSNVDAILADTGTDGVVVAAASKTGYTLTATTGLGNQTANITGNLSGTVAGVTPAAAGAQMDLVNAPNATAIAALQNGLATPTNITAGTLTTVTNLTNAPTSGDLTAMMKASVTTAATAATPNAASVTGAVGSVTGLTAADVAAIKVATDKFVFTLANQLDVNVQSVNDVAVTGTGASGDEWGP